jgi:phage terminase small subunit
MRAQEMITVLQNRFVYEFVRPGPKRNLTEVAVAAGYNRDTAYPMALKLLANSAVQAAIREQLDAQAARALLTADRVVREIMRLAFFNPKQAYRDGVPIPIDQLPDEVAAAIEAVEVHEELDPIKKTPARVTRYKFSSKLNPLRLLAEHVGVVVNRLQLLDSRGRAINPASAQQPLPDFSDVTQELLEKIAAVPA